MRKTKRTYKDSLFRDIFKDARRLLPIYEALECESIEVNDIELTTLDEAFFDSEKNDVSFIVKHQHMILIEHQSTVNENMPLRLLWYIAELYRQYVGAKLPYRVKRVPLPAPKFYVFYNGTVTMPPRWRLRLSDAFGGRKGTMELSVEVLNINVTAGCEILETCAPLKAYSIFVAKVRQAVAEGHSLREAVPQAITYCIENAYLPEYFQEKQESEVFDMMNFQWDADLALQVRAEEALAEGMEKGMEKGRAEGMEKGMEKGKAEGMATSIRRMMEGLGVSMEKAMDVLRIPIEERAKYAALVKE